MLYTNINYKLMKRTIIVNDRKELSYDDLICAKYVLIINDDYLDFIKNRKIGNVSIKDMFYPENTFKDYIKLSYYKIKNYASIYKTK